MTTATQDRRCLSGDVVSRDMVNQPVIETDVVFRTTGSLQLSLYLLQRKTYKRSNDTKCISMQIMGKPRGSDSRRRWNNLQKFVRSSRQNWRCFSLYRSNKMHASMKGKNEGKKSLCTHWFVGVRGGERGERTRRECIKSLSKWLPIHYWFVDAHDWICE